MSLTPKKRVGRAIHQQLIERFVQGERTVPEIAQELGLSLSQVAAWAADPRAMTTLERLARLAEIRAQMVLSRFRANAAIQLIQIAGAKELSELSRKACVDVLAADLKAFDRPATDDAHLPESVMRPPRNEAAILRAFEKLGKESSPPPL